MRARSLVQYIALRDGSVLAATIHDSGLGLLEKVGAARDGGGGATVDAAAH